MKKLMLTGILVGLMAAVSQANLLSNGGFEGGSTISDVPSWTGWGGNGTLETGYSHESSQSVRFWFNDTGMYQDFSATAGTSYDTSIYAYTPSTDKYTWDAENNTFAGFKIEWFDSSDAKLDTVYSTSFTPDNSADTWTKLTSTLTAPASTSYGRMVVAIEGAAPGSGTVAFDSADVVVAVPEPVSAGLLGLGIAFIYMMRRKVQK